MRSVYDPEMLMMASLGIGQETIHIQNIVAKKLKREDYDYYELFTALGDMFFFWWVICLHLGHNPDDVIRASMDRIRALAQEATQCQSTNNTAETATGDTTTPRGSTVPNAENRS